MTHPHLTSSLRTTSTRGVSPADGSSRARVVEEVSQINARHVIFGTVPHVTIAPLARGVPAEATALGKKKVADGSRYFPYYSRPWIEPEDFDPRDDKFLTAAQARAVDSAIDMYNDSIAAAVKQKRGAGCDWYLVDVAGVLDRLAARRYLEDPSAQPSWWTELGGEYPLPPALKAVTPKLTSHFFRCDANGRSRGGLFSLDGVHPTTIGYGLVAQEMINVMQLAGVSFRFGDGSPRTGKVDVDFERLLKIDSLVSNPPKSLTNTMEFLGWLDASLDGLLSKIGLAARWP